MRNPWLEINADPPYLLKNDLQEIDTFNQKYRKTDYEIQPELIPEPYIGNFNSNIVLLNLNPGCSVENYKEHSEPIFKSILLKNLSNINQSFPFYYLNPELSHVRGAIWWSKMLRGLVERFGPKNVSNNLLCVEFFPYHSKKYRHISRKLESQKFNFDLVHQAIHSHRLIIIMRSKKIWEEAIPALTKYNKVFALKNPQNVCITKNNCPDGFPLIEELFLNDFPESPKT